MEYAGADNQEPDPTFDLCCPWRDSGLSCMVVSGPGEAQPASSALRPRTDRHVRSVLGRCPRHMVEEKSCGAEDWDLRHKKPHYVEAFSSLDGRERVQGSERLAEPIFTKGGRV